MGKGIVGCGLIVVLIVVLIGGLVVWGVGVHNGLVSLDEGVNTA